MKTGRSLSVLLVAFALLLSFSVCGFADVGGDAFIEISNAAELKEFRDNVNSAGGESYQCQAHGGYRFRRYGVDSNRKRQCPPL